MSRAAIRFACGLLAASGLAAQSGCSASVGEGPPNLVFITIDTLRADRLGAYGYFRNTSPVLDALARESLVFERCFAPMATTFPSHLSLFTSTYPNETGAIANFGSGGKAFQPTDQFRTLAQVLRKGGYQTAGFVSAAPLKRSSGIAHGFEVFTQPEKHTRRGDRTSAEALQWLDATDDRPFFLWVHYFDPHWPYAPPPPFSDKFQSSPRLSAYFEKRVFADPGENEADIEAVNNQYDGEVSYVDSEIGKLLDALRAREEDWENTVVVVTSDHGEGLYQHGESQHGLVWNEQLRVALFMRIPGHAPARIDRVMSVADIVPTLMGLIEIPGEDAFRRQASGVDRLSGEQAEAYIFSQESMAPFKNRPRKRRPGYSLTGEAWKFVLGPEGGKSLYRLVSDPHELEDVSEEYPEVTERLHAILNERLAKQKKKFARYRGEAPDAGSDIDPALIEQLRALGYIE